MVVADKIECFAQAFKQLSLYETNMAQCYGLAGGVVVVTDTLVVQLYDKLQRHLAVIFVVEIHSLLVV